ncbi:MAG TPA: lipocalin-like domain-containing protein [Roseiflexaceae bacterium]
MAFKFEQLEVWRRAIVYRLSSIVLVNLLLVACSGSAQTALPSGQVAVAESLGGQARAGFARATSQREFVFPRDHGPHQEYAIEWWYYTGNLDAQPGRHFGYQLTFFRIGLAPQPAQRPSDWAASNIYMAHFALADVAAGKFYAFERFSRGAAGLAGAQGQPFRVRLEDWGAEGAGAGALPMRLRAAQGDIAIDLALQGGKPVVLQGDRGLSQKSAEPGNASYYYSLTRMPTRGSVRVGSESIDVSGLSWMDHEWSTSVLGAGAIGWDWFAVQLSDGRDLMYARLRDSGGATLYAYGTLVAADGSARPLAPAEMALDATGSWQSQRSGGRYPSGWRLQVPAAGLDLRIVPYLADQELPLTTVYWEGAVKVEGTAGGAPIGGSGYVELTGYADRPGEVQVR